MGDSIRSPLLLDAPVFVGLTGHTGSGKTSATDYLVRQYGFDSVRYSRVLQDWLGVQSDSKTRLQQVGWQIMTSGRQSELNAQLISQLKPGRSTVIDGLRHAVDFECLSWTLGSAFALIFIETEKTLRLQRTLARFGSKDRFHESEQEPVESFIEDLLPCSSAVIVNNSSLDHLHSELDLTIKRLFAKVAA